MSRRTNKIFAIVLCFLLIFQQAGFAEMAVQLNLSGYLAGLHSAFPQDKFRPLHLRYLSYDNLNNSFRLLLDKGDTKNPQAQELESTSKTLLNYFFIGLSLPNDSFWVNLRPDSEANVIDPWLAQTDIGRIMLETDLQLKKDTAKATSPETPEGRKYWDLLYKKAEELFGYENVTIPTLTRPWIVPGEIIIRETNDSAYIYKATLKVMLEQDYLKDSTTYNFKDPRLKALNEYSSQLIRELIIPKLNKEVNSSKRYASLRQVYYSLIMAQWFKARFRNKPWTCSQAIDHKVLANLTSKTHWTKTTYFQEYQKSFKNGEYNIREPRQTPFGQTIRSYFSGGEVLSIAVASLGSSMSQVTTYPANIHPVDSPQNIAVEVKGDRLQDTTDSNAEAPSEHGAIMRNVSMEEVEKLISEKGSDIDRATLQGEFEVIEEVLDIELIEDDPDIIALARRLKMTKKELLRRVAAAGQDLLASRKTLKQFSAIVKNENTYALGIATENILGYGQEILTRLRNKKELRTEYLLHEALCYHFRDYPDGHQIAREIQMILFPGNYENLTPEKRQSFREKGNLTEALTGELTDILYLFIKTAASSLQERVGGKIEPVRETPVRPERPKAIDSEELVKSPGESGLADLPPAEGGIPIHSVLANLPQGKGWERIPIKDFFDFRQALERCVRGEELDPKKDPLVRRAIGFLGAMRRSIIGERLLVWICSHEEGDREDSNLDYRLAELYAVFEFGRYFARGQQALEAYGVYLGISDIGQVNPALLNFLSACLAAYTPSDFFNFISEFKQKVPSPTARRLLRVGGETLGWELFDAVWQEEEVLTEEFFKVLSAYGDVLAEAFNELSIHETGTSKVRLISSAIDRLTHIDHKKLKAFRKQAKHNPLLLLYILTFDLEEGVLPQGQAEVIFHGSSLGNIERMIFESGGFINAADSGDEGKRTWNYFSFDRSISAMFTDPRKWGKEEGMVLEFDVRTLISLGLYFQLGVETDIAELICEEPVPLSALTEKSKREVFVEFSRPDAPERNLILAEALGYSSVDALQAVLFSDRPMEDRGVIHLTPEQTAELRGMVVEVYKEWSESSSEYRDKHPVPALLLGGAYDIIRDLPMRSPVRKAAEDLERLLPLPEEFDLDAFFKGRELSPEEEILLTLLLSPGQGRGPDKDDRENGSTPRGPAMPGGIDFRSLPIVTQAIGNLRMDLGSAARERLDRVNLAEELQQLQRIIASGIAPSSERIKEFVQASCAKGNFNKDKVILCISGILRMEEESNSSTDLMLRDILVVLESSRSTTELKEVFLEKGS
jgi:hypothetical protein